MYNAIQTWFNTITTGINSGLTGTSSDMREVDTILDSSKLSSNLSDRSFQIKIENVEVDYNNESYAESYDVKIDFWFLIANKVSNYETSIDTYLRAIKQELKDFTEYTSSTFAIAGISDIKINGLNNITNGGSYLNPNITFKLLCFDDASVTILSPGIVITGQNEYYIQVLINGDTYKYIMLADIEETSSSAVSQITTLEQTEYYVKVLIGDSVSKYIILADLDGTANLVTPSNVVFLEQNEYYIKCLINGSTIKYIILSDI